MCKKLVLPKPFEKCGAVCNWKRLQDSNGKFKAFGFCDFLHPDGARKALRVLKNYPLGDRRLNVKASPPFVFFLSCLNGLKFQADEQTEKLLEEFAAKRAKASTESVTNEEKEDNELRETIKQIIEEQAPELLELTPLEEGWLNQISSNRSNKAIEFRRAAARRRVGKCEAERDWLRQWGQGLSSFLFLSFGSLNSNPFSQSTLGFECCSQSHNLSIFLTSSFLFCSSDQVEKTRSQGPCLSGTITFASSLPD